MKIENRFNLVILSIFASWPFISFVTHNLNKGVEITELINVYFVFMLVIIIIYLLAGMVIGNTGKLLKIFILITICFFNFSVVEKIVPGVPYRYLILIWILITFSLSLALWKLSSDTIGSYKPLIIIAIVLYTVPVVKIIGYNFKSYQQIADTHASIAYETITGLHILNKKPNVYFFIVDGFARSDVLASQFKYDNSSFIGELEKKGFFVAKKSRANYPLTYLSIASTLNMNYIIGEGKNVLKNRKQFYPYMQGNNAVVRFFKNQGYRYVHSYNQFWSGSKCSSELIDNCIYQMMLDGVPFASSESVINLLRLTPLHNPLVKLESGSHGLKVLTKKLVDILTTYDEPFFVFAHVMAPHAPNTYGKDCAVVSPNPDLKKWQAKIYITQVQCVENDLKILIDTILDLDKNDPIIIVQSDHGSSTRGQFEKPKAEWDSEDIIERTGILNVIYANSECKKYLYQTITPVNTFRVITSCLSGRTPELLDDKSMFATYEEYPDYGLITPF